MNDLYTDVEKVILSDFFELPYSEELADVEIDSVDPGGICLDPDLDHNTAVRNAVARMVLGGIQSRLPQTGVARPDGVVLTRAHFDKVPRDVLMLPQFLFMINWADTAPGISWPESYYLTYLPGFDRYVVTASFDSPDMYGVTDLAIGSFTSEGEWIEGLEQVILRWWGHQLDFDQPRFAYVWNEGRIGLDLANEWADLVWPPMVEEEADA